MRSFQFDPFVSGYPNKTLDKILTEISEFDTLPSWMGATRHRNCWRTVLRDKMTAAKVDVPGVKWEGS